MNELLKEVSGKSESLSQLVIDIFEDLEKLIRQELSLSVASTQEMIEKVTKQIPRYFWLGLCISITVVFSAFALVEAFKTIAGLPMWAVYGLSGVTFLAVGIIGYAVTGSKKEDSSLEKNKDRAVRLASVHSLNEGEHHA